MVNCKDTKLNFTKLKCVHMHMHWDQYLTYIKTRHSKHIKWDRLSLSVRIRHLRKLLFVPTSAQTHQFQIFRMFSLATIHSFRRISPHIHPVRSREMRKKNKKFRKFQKRNDFISKKCISFVVTWSRSRNTMDFPVLIGNARS